MEVARGVGVEVPPARVAVVLLRALLHARVVPVPLEVMPALVGQLAGALHVEAEFRVFPTEDDVDGTRGFPNERGFSTACATT